MRYLRLFGCLYTDTPIKSSWFGGNFKEEFSESSLLKEDLKRTEKNLRKMIKKGRHNRSNRFEIKSLFNQRRWLKERLS